MIKHSKTRLAALVMAAALLGSLFLSSCGQQETQTTQEETQTAQGVNINYGISNPWDSLMPYYSVSGSNYSRIIWAFFIFQQWAERYLQA